MVSKGNLIINTKDSWPPVPSIIYAQSQMAGAFCGKVADIGTERYIWHSGIGHQW